MKPVLSYVATVLTGPVTPWSHLAWSYGVWNQSYVAWKF